jgi:hypothetical protein
MEDYLRNIFDINNSISNENRLSFINTLTLDTFSNASKSLIKHSKTPPKTKLSKSNFNLNKIIIDKEVSDIDATRNISEKNLFKNTIFKKDLKNEDENNRYINVKEVNNELTTPKNENKPNINVRKDIFGNEIKKGGKQKIAFADNAHILMSRKKLEDEGNDNYRKRHRNSVQLTNINNDKNKPNARGKRRSIIAFKSDKLIKRFNFGNSDKKIISLVEVIEIQSYKEFNKISNFNIPEENENIKGIQDTVCCSVSCFIY